MRFGCLTIAAQMVVDQLRGVIEGNDISTPGNIADIYVVANRNSGSQPCRRVDIAENTTRSNGIFIAGDPASENRVRGNRHMGGEGVIRNAARAHLSHNRGYRMQQ